MIFSRVLDPIDMVLNVVAAAMASAANGAYGRKTFSGSAGKASQPTA